MYRRTGATQPAQPSLRWMALFLVVVVGSACATQPDGTDMSVPDESVLASTTSMTAVPPEATANSRPSGQQPMHASPPMRIEIPAIGVDSDLMELGLQSDGSLEVPPGAFPAGWYTGAPTPGEVGPAIIAGHVSWGGIEGVFYDLRDLAIGDEITIYRQDGSTALFRVARVESFPKIQFPTEAVYGDLDHAGLRVITCGGAFDSNARSHRDNIVAFAELIESSPPSV